MTLFLLNILNWMFDLIQGIVPDLSEMDGFMGNVGSYLDMIFDFVAQVNFIIPLDVIVTIVSLDVSFRLIMFGFYWGNRLINAILDVIP